MARTSSDRKAEAARYKQLSDAARVVEVDMSLCEYDKARKLLKLASEHIGMPRTFFVKSHHTGKVVRFAAVGPEDVLFCPDQWDGEMQVYRPIGNVPNVDRMVIYNQW